MVQFTTSNNEFEVLLDDEDVGLEEVSALSVDESGDGLLWVADESWGEVWTIPFDTSYGYPDDEVEGVVEIDADRVRDLRTWDGYAMATTSDGDLLVLTERPWVEVSGVSSTTVFEGEEVSFDFTSDLEGTWELVLVEDGEVLGEGEVLAEETTSSSFTIDDSFAEGENLLSLVVEADEGLGQDSFYVDVDNPPSTVSLGTSGVGFGNRQVTVSFEGIDDEDLDYYTVYVTVAPFESGDHESGGPDFDGTDDVDLPLEVEADPGESVIFTISPLTNGQTYYVAVRAHDEGGQEGEMSDVIEVTPQETFSASGLSGEQGGFCGSGPWAWVFAFPALGWARRRGGRSLVRGASLVLLGVLVGQPAFAEDDRHASIELRYGPVALDDSNIQAVFGDTGHEVLWLE
ncbi:MAG: hypothetical protein QGG40_21140, partial [Myxococcota bacterium]|nr:hypothetical protein [Myxococcota bacterium]